MIPTSAHVKSLPVATPLAKLPKPTRRRHRGRRASRGRVQLRREPHRLGNRLAAVVRRRRALGSRARSPSRETGVPAATNTAPLASLACGLTTVPAALRDVAEQEIVRPDDEVRRRAANTVRQLRRVDRRIVLHRTRICPTSLYLAVTLAWPFVKVTFCAAAAASVTAAFTPSICTFSVPVAGFVVLRPELQALRARIRFDDAAHRIVGRLAVRRDMNREVVPAVCGLANGTIGGTGGFGAPRRSA